MGGKNGVDSKQRKTTDAQSARGCKFKIHLKTNCQTKILQNSTWSFDCWWKSTCLPAQELTSWASTATSTRRPVWRRWSWWWRAWRRPGWRLTSWSSRWRTTLLTAAARASSTCPSSPSVCRHTPQRLKEQSTHLLPPDNVYQVKCRSPVFSC